MKLTIRTALAADQPAIEAVLDAAFGEDRFQRTAYRVREGMDALAVLSFVAEQDGRIVASLQCWPVEIRDGTAPGVPLVMLGPVAVLPYLQRSGIGKRLMRHALAAADREGVGAIMLIGDHEYYGQFGFEPEATQNWDLPGPFERHRLLVRLAEGVHLPAAGMVGPRDTATTKAA